MGSGETRGLLFLDIPTYVEMNENAIAVRLQEQAVVRRVVAGLPEAPPATVEYIYRWANAQMAAHRAWHQNDVVNATKIDIKKHEQGLKEAHENNDEEQIDYEIERLETFREHLKHDEDRLEELIQETKSFPRVKVKKWNRVARKFKMDTRGWKYQSLLKGADQKRLDYANNLWGVITVELVRGNLQTKSNAYWKPSTASLKIQAGSRLKKAIKHELIHWAQSYLNIALWIKDFGRPSKEIQTPEIQQHPSDSLKRQLKKRGIKPDEFHGLDDIEFYTDLIDEVDHFTRLDESWGRTEHFPTRLDLFKVFVGDKEPPTRIGPRGKKMVSGYFLALKKHAVGKWKKAVKELAKAVI